MELIIGIVSSVAAALLIFLGRWLWSKHLVLTYAVLRSGIVKVFQNADAAEEDIEKEALHSQVIKYLGVYNTTLLGRPVFNETLLYRTLSKRSSDNYPEMEFMHISADSLWAKSRADEIGFPMDTITEGLRKSESCLRQVVLHLRIPGEKVHLRHHDSVLRFRILMLSDILYLNMYLPGRSMLGRQSPSFKIRRGAELFSVVEAYYNSIQEHASREHDFLKDEEARGAKKAEPTDSPDCL